MTTLAEDIETIIARHRNNATPAPTKPKAIPKGKKVVEAPTAQMENLMNSSYNPAQEKAEKVVKPKRVLSQKQLDALQAGREKRAANRVIPSVPEVQE
jgi:hypothetical protein